MVVKIPSQTMSERESSSFRDPAGFLFRQAGVLYRQINQFGREDYESLMETGLYQKLVDGKVLIPHTEVSTQAFDPQSTPYTDPAYKIIQPELVDFISYPYEWSFSQLKDAALCTLSIQKIALECGVTLKDSSAYNIQFQSGQPVLIDSLSFTPYHEGEPWVAYRQFCQHFLAPLALMALTDVRLSQLLRLYIDGIPLDLTSELLPWKTRLPGGLYLHIHLHAAAQRKYAGQPTQQTNGRKISKIQMLGMVDSLERTIKGLEWKKTDTAWADYLSQHNYSETALTGKKEAVTNFLSQAQPGKVWDLGANVGVFSRLACAQGAQTLAFDLDPAAVEQNYLACKAEKLENLLPLILDLTNPSPGLGWQNHERRALSERGPADLIMALALVHHLAISNNVPLSEIAAFFASLGEWLIIEFVPKEDSQVQKLLASRLDIFKDYHIQGFEAAFSGFYELIEKTPLPESLRTLYLMRRIPV